MLNGMFNHFYKDKTVLVTGHTGFKGSWLSLWLKEMGARVIGFSLDPYTDRDNFVLCGLTDKMVDIRGDIRDFDTLLQVFEDYKPEVVFHLAAQPLVRLSYDEPRETYDINVGGTVNVLECIRKTESVKTAVMITTDKCYENKEWIWGYRENDALGGYDPYSSSKAAAELTISGYRNSFFHPKDYDKHGKLIASVRAGNVIGGGDWSKDRIIPDCIRALETGQPIQVRNPAATRPWQHVLEPLSGYLLLASRMASEGAKFAGAWNFGPDFDSILPVGKIVEKVISYWGSGQWLDLSEQNKSAVHEATLLALDCSKAKTLLHWKPALNMDETVEFTVDWYKNYKSSDVYTLCLNQIKAFAKKMEEAT
ncbi:MAG: CDP-glucose 4,6-dehydratase [Clostridia bacterium]|nr:CDP-glucose 4,6-dehydratase [Clostridia bacterium]